MLSRFREQFGFSQWIFLRNVLGFARSQVDTLLVTKNFAMAEVGVFHVAKSLTAMPAKDVVAPAVEPLLAAFSRVRDDRADLVFKIRVSICFVTFLIMPVCVYIALFPESIVDVFLGDQWTGAYVILANMTPLLLTLSVSRVFESICIAIDRAARPVRLQRPLDRVPDRVPDPAGGPGPRIVRAAPLAAGSARDRALSLLSVLSARHRPAPVGRVVRAGRRLGADRRPA